ncbi:hypothetical protein H4R34_004909 [Dimargaris verticillata]|uniref:Uncharacterized protein n=1 Tax=Dimargaris verticillata TaxID=2761393 RepID=A0A9W8B4M4_9FUNG|nr:hypothetical protein H4R34_004909 [Dimargaris verticillata]
MRLVAAAATLLATIACVRAIPLPTFTDVVGGTNCQQLREMYRSSQDLGFISHSTYLSDVVEQCLPDFAGFTLHQRKFAIRKAYDFLKSAQAHENPSNANPSSSETLNTVPQEKIKDSYIVIALYSVDNQSAVTMLATPTSDDSLLQFAPRRNVPASFDTVEFTANNSFMRGVVQYLSVVLLPMQEMALRHSNPTLPPYLYSPDRSSRPMQHLALLSKNKSSEAES